MRSEKLSPKFPFLIFYRAPGQHLPNTKWIDYHWTVTLKMAKNRDISIEINGVHWNCTNTKSVSIIYRLWWFFPPIISFDIYFGLQWPYRLMSFTLMVHRHGFQLNCVEREFQNEHRIFISLFFCPFVCFILLFFFGHVHTQSDIFGVCFVCFVELIVFCFEYMV